MTTGEKIRKIREDVNLSQEQFAEMLSVTRQSVSKWESDKNFPETSKLLLIAKEFDTSVDYLLRDNILLENIETNDCKLQDIIKYHELITIKQRRRIDKILFKVLLVLVVLQIAQVLYNIIAYGSISPQIANILYLDWDTQSLLRGTVFNLVLLPLFIFIVIRVIAYFNNINRSKDFDILLGLVDHTTHSVRLKYKMKVYILMSMINILFIARLYFNVFEIRILTAVMDSFAIPGFNLGKTLFPSQTAMVEQIFSLNIISLTMFSITMIVLTFLFVNFREIKRNRTILIGLVTLSSVSLLILLLSNVIFGGLLCLVLTGNLMVLKIILNYYDSKPLLKLSIIYFLFVTLVSIVRFIFEFNSFGGFIESSSGVFGLVMYSDIISTQSAANVLLISIVTDGFVAMQGVVVWGAFIYGIFKIIDVFKKNKMNLKFIDVSYVWFFASTTLLAIIVMGGMIYESISLITLNNSLSEDGFYEKSTILSNQCFSDKYLEREMGNNIIDDNLLFVSCFDTTEGVYSVYYRVSEYEKKNLFDLYYEDVEYDKIYVKDEENNTVLELDYLGPYSQIYITTFDEVSEGYMNIISYRYVNKDLHWSETDISDWSIDFYDIESNHITSLEGVIIHANCIKSDSLIYDGQKYMITNNELFYLILEDSPKFYVYNFESDITTEITGEDWEEYTDNSN